MTLVKGDFYYGALLARLVNGGFAPAIVEPGEAKRIYKFSNNLDYKLYAKYISEPTYSKYDKKRWDFRFSRDEISKIISNTEINIFAFICGIDDDSPKSGELCFLSRDQLLLCFGKEFITPERRISISLDKKGSWSFSVYGTGLERKQEAIKIIRNVEKRLQDFQSVLLS